MNKAEESELLTRCRAGDHAAWDALFDLHYAAAGRFIFQLDPFLSREDVEEICQDAFLAVIRNVDSFHGECRFQTWLFRIATNKARDFRERQQAAKRGGGHSNISLDAQDSESGLRLELPSPAASPDASLIGQERIVLLHAALNRLGEPCREVIELRYFADLSYEEISASLSLNVKTVSSRLSKCLDKLEEIASPIFSGEINQSFPSNQ